MRATILFLLLPAACALPDLDVPEEDRAARADYPVLVPFEDVTDRARAMPEVDPEIGPTLADRAEALRERAADIEAPAADAEAEARAARLRQRAQGLR